MRCRESRMIRVNKAVETSSNDFACIEGGVVAFQIFELGANDTERKFLGVDLRLSLEGFPLKLYEIGLPTQRGCAIVITTSSLDSTVTILTEGLVNVMEGDYCWKIYVSKT